MKKLLTIAGVAVVGSAYATDFFEVEDNNNKSQANVVSGMAAGDRIIGVTTGTSTTVAGIASSDNFRVSTAAAPLGVYRYRLVLTTQGTAGHTGTIRGLSQVASAADTSPGKPWDGVVGSAGTTDATVQSSSTVTTPQRFNQWYGFGKQEEIYYRVTGTTSTTAEYNATLEREVVSVTDVGVYLPGQINISTFGQGHTTDTDLWVYDSNFDAIAGYGNDDESTLGGTPGTGATLQSWLSRPYTPGVYYIALSNFQLANNMASPSDDDFRTGSLLDFPNAIANSSTTVNLNMTFTIDDKQGNSMQVINTKVGPYDVNWFKFTVVPEPGTFLAIGAGLALLALRRRK